MPMNVILLERVPKLGQMGDVVKVKPGFARNYLLPQKKALRASLQQACAPPHSHGRTSEGALPERSE